MGSKIIGEALLVGITTAGIAAHAIGSAVRAKVAKEGEEKGAFGAELPSYAQGGAL